MASLHSLMARNLIKDSNIVRKPLSRSVFAGNIDLRLRMQTEISGDYCRKRIFEETVINASKHDSTAQKKQLNETRKSLAGQSNSPLSRQLTLPLSLF